MHRAPHTDYKTVDLHVATKYPQEFSDNGAWRVFGGDLYLIKYVNTDSRNVELLVFKGDTYQEFTRYSTWFNIADGTNGTWQIGGQTGTLGNLYFVKYKNTGTLNVEVHIATSASQYQQVDHYVTRFDQNEGTKGTWHVY